MSRPRNVSFQSYWSNIPSYQRNKKLDIFLIKRYFDKSIPLRKCKYSMPRPFINDPQPPFFHNGLWHLYYLWNNDFPSGNGTDWRHAVSEDLQDWRDAGLAIRKYQTPYGDPWSGCVVVDHDNTAGFGPDAVIALCTMPMQEGGIGQSTTRWVSHDGGYSFAFDRTVMHHPKTVAPGSAFRDPRLVWMTRSRCWILVLAEASKIGFYRSSDLANWSYVSGFLCDTLGTLECPALFPIRVSGHSDAAKAVKWVLICGANGFATGFTTGTYYWIGAFDGTNFTPDDPTGQWLDSGSDFYATVVFGQTQITDEPQERLFAIAWKNNWNYAIPVTKAGYFGSYSAVRSIALSQLAGELKLTNVPWWNGSPYSYESMFGVHKLRHKLTPEASQDLPKITCGTYLFFASLSKGVEAWPENIQIDLQSGAGTPVQIILFPREGYVTLDRSQSGFTPKTDPEWLKPRNAALTFEDHVNILAIVNTSSIELIFNDGTLSMTSLVFPTKRRNQPRITVHDGVCILDHYGTASYNNVFK
ncbi:glycoside hydrolase family 32 protein [Gluconobacter sp. P5B12]|uniref:glycoside hydrolase family 32 protein n=1 Tax=Gluconobacter sp. P5B12 TaxID=2762618 RepID=UPI001C05B30D|nr:glycoside hydrolase family 32 protein [Gluconobacter sp. P5B12]